jgi:hypothetical protein
MWLFKSYPLDKYDLSWTTSVHWTENYSRTMSPSRFTAKKSTKNIGEEKSTNTENQKHPPVPSITTLFNLLVEMVNKYTLLITLGYIVL